MCELPKRTTKDRDWQQFHSPKNLASALVVEAVELLEHFQWLTPDQAANLPPDTREAVALECADVLLFLIRLADKHMYEDKESRRTGR